MITPVKGSEFTVRHCHGIEEFKLCFALQQSVWGNSDIDIPVPMFVVAAETGGQVLGAFDGDRMVGFTLAIAGWRDGKVFLHSHMTAVLADYRNRGVGRSLKIFQLDDAIARGIFLIEWTFDPLEVKNAYFNLMRLGALARRYLPNVYGITSSPLHGGIPTDRLVAEWWLASYRVKVATTGQLRSPHQIDPSRQLPEILVPADLPEPRQADLAKSIAIQTTVREQFQNWLAKGYVATAIENGPEGARYILEPLKDPARKG